MWQSHPSYEIRESRIVAQIIKRRIDFQTYKLHIVLVVGLVEHLERLIFYAIAQQFAARSRRFETGRTHNPFALARTSVCFVFRKFPNLRKTLRLPSDYLAQ
jgi:hypothetical protein